MEGLTLSAKEQNRLHILNGILERHWSMKEAAPLLGVSERQGWRLLAALEGKGPPVWHTRTGAGCRGNGDLVSAAPKLAGQSPNLTSSPSTADSIVSSSGWYPAATSAPILLN